MILNKILEMFRERCELCNSTGSVFGICDKCNKLLFLDYIKHGINMSDVLYRARKKNFISIEQYIDLRDKMLTVYKIDNENVLKQNLRKTIQELTKN